MSWLDRLIALIRPAPRPVILPGPGPVAPPGPTPPTVATAARDLLAAVNAARRAVGLPALKADARLERCAAAWSAECARRGVLSHFSADRRSTPWTRITAVGLLYLSASENAGMGQRTADEVVANWVGERPPGITGHRDNVLSPAFNCMGGGAAAGRDGRVFWIVDFAEEPAP